MMQRRSFLKGLGAVPAVVQAQWFATRGAGSAAPRALIVLELEGGNDGLNTLIPMDDDGYAKARPSLSSVRGEAHDVGAGFALHPSLRGMARWINEGYGAAIHGVGYPNPNRSHFYSRDIWHAADPSLTRVAAETTGWLGRVASHLAGATDVPALCVGGATVPLILRTPDVQVPAFDRLDGEPVAVDGRGGGAGARRAALKRHVAGGVGGEGRRGAPSPMLEELQAAARAAMSQGDRLRAGLGRYQAGAEYPATELGRRLQLIARVLVSGLGCQVFHVVHTGYDTHARQLPTHAALLAELDGALDAFCRDLKHQQLLDTTAMMIHSEFGRRVAENQSQGTDHGAAAPAFVLGGGVVPGLHGRAPDLSALDEGDVPMTCDFRRLLSACVGSLGVGFLGVGEPVFAGDFGGALPLF